MCVLHIIICTINTLDYSFRNNDIKYFHRYVGILMKINCFKNVQLPTILFLNSQINVFCVQKTKKFINFVLYR